MMNHESELSIIEKAKTEPEAFGILFDKYYSMIFHYALKRTASIPIAQDVTSEVFFKALKNLHKYKYRGYPLSSWLYRIANNEISNIYNRNNHDKLYSQLILKYRDSANPSVETELIEGEEILSRQQE
ncbi:RNA polymerase sigma factor, partial [Chloroflexota bacterium]